MHARCFRRAALAALLALQGSSFLTLASSLAENTACEGDPETRLGVGLIQYGLGSVNNTGRSLEDDRILHVQPPGINTDAVLLLKPEEAKALHHAEEEEEHLSHLEAREVVCVCVVMTLCFCSFHFLHHHHIYVLPEGLAAILWGVILGFSLKYFAKAEFMNQMDRNASGQVRPAEFFCLILLPPLMFESGWSMRRLDFISQLPYILNFAVLGSLISVVLIGLILRTTGEAGLHPITQPRSCLAIAAAFAATDPVATLGIYAQLKVEPLLNIMVAGESLLNDLIAIVLFNLFNEGEETSTRSILTPSSFLATMRLFMGSVAVGVSVGVLHCGMLRVAELKSSKRMEIILLIVTSYLVFALGELFHFSGIIATLVNGILMGQYARPHLSLEGSLLATFVLSEVNTIFDASISLVCGLAFLKLGVNGGDVTLGFYLFMACLGARAAGTCICGYLSNLGKQMMAKNGGSEAQLNLLTPAHLIMIWHGGLRGAISLWLIAHIGPWMDELEGPGTRLTVQSACLLVVTAFLVVFGGTTKMCLERAGISMGEHFDHNALSKSELRPWATNIMSWFHDKLLQPALVGEETPHSASFMLRFGRRVEVEALIKQATDQQLEVLKKEHEDEHRLKKQGTASWF